MQSSQDSYDKYIISLSSSALGLSFVFLDKLVDIDHAYYKWFLLSSWLSWDPVTFAEITEDGKHSVRSLRGEPK